MAKIVFDEKRREVKSSFLFWHKRDDYPLVGEYITPYGIAFVEWSPTKFSITFVYDKKHYYYSVIRCKEPKKHYPYKDDVERTAKAFVEKIVGSKKKKKKKKIGKFELLDLE